MKTVQSAFGRKLAADSELRKRYEKAIKRFRKALSGEVEIIRQSENHGVRI